MMCLKKMYCCLCLLFLFTLSATQAQNIRGGLVGGFNTSQIRGDNVGGYYKFGLNFGAKAQLPLSEDLTGSMELIATQKGSASKFDANQYAYFRIALDYIEVPILVNYHINEQIYLGGGIGVGRLIWFRKYDSYGYDPNAEAEHLINYDFNLMANLGYAFNKHWIGNMRLAYSFIPIGSVASSGEPAWNNVLSARIIYMF